MTGISSTGIFNNKMRILCCSSSTCPNTESVSESFILCNSCHLLKATNLGSKRQVTPDEMKSVVNAFYFQNQSNFGHSPQKQLGVTPFKIPHHDSKQFLEPQKGNGQKTSQCLVFDLMIMGVGAQVQEKRQGFWRGSGR